VVKPLSADRTDAPARLGADPRRGRVSSTNGFVAGAAFLVCGLALAVSALASGLDEWRDGPQLALCALVASCVGVAHLVFFELPRRLRTATAFAAVASIFAVFVFTSTAVYLVTGTFDRFDDALFESTAGFTTTALSVLERPEDAARGIVLWRALTQWIGGFTALAVIVGLLPFLGVGGLEVSDITRSTRRVSFFSPRTRSLLSRLGLLYLALTAAGIALFAVGGMGPFDAVTYALTTISTGGFENHAGSFAFFDSALIEWFAVGGMAMAGINIALVAAVLRGNVGPLRRSSELRVYGGILVAGTLVVFLQLVGDLSQPWSTTLRDAAFSVTSVVSTTGASVTDWGGWPVGPQVVLLMFMGVGSMSGSTGSGFRIVRAMALFGYVRRELVRQVQPHSVVAVKVGRAPLDEALVSRLIGYQILWVVVAGFAAIGVALFDVDLVSSLSVAISALANVGPALGDVSPSAGATGLTAGARMVLVPVMLLGRLEISPLIVGLLVLFRVPRRWPGAVRRAWIRRR